MSDSQETSISLAQQAHDLKAELEAKKQQLVDVALSVNAMQRAKDSLDLAWTQLVKTLQRPV